MQLVKTMRLRAPMRSSPLRFYAAFIAGRSVVGFKQAESFFSEMKTEAQQSTVDHQNDPTIFVHLF